MWHFREAFFAPVTTDNQKSLAHKRDLFQVMGTDRQQNKVCREGDDSDDIVGPQQMARLYYGAEVVLCAMRTNVGVWVGDPKI